MWRFLVVLALLAALLVGPATVWAQTVLSISPVRVDRVARPGEIIELVLTVRNPSSQTASIVASPRDIAVNPENGQVTIGDPTLMSLRDWVEVEPSRFTLGPGQTMDVRARLRVPENASPGGRYGAITFTTGEPVPGKLSFTGEVATILYVRVRASTSLGATGILEPNPVPIATTPRVAGWLQVPLIALSWPLDIRLGIRNDGVSDARTQAAVRVYGWGTDLYANYNPPPVNVFPGSTRSETVSVSGGIWTFGPFAAVAEVTDQESRLVYVSEPSVFWMVPTLPLLGLLLLLTAAVILFAAGRVSASAGRRRVATAAFPGGAPPPGPAQSPVGAAPPPPPPLTPAAPILRREPWEPRPVLSSDTVEADYVELPPRGPVTFTRGSQRPSRAGDPFARTSKPVPRLPAGHERWARTSNPDDPADPFDRTPAGAPFAPPSNDPAFGDADGVATTDTWAEDSWVDDGYEATAEDADQGGQEWYEPKRRPGLFDRIRERREARRREREAGEEPS